MRLDYCLDGVFLSIPFPSVGSFSSAAAFINSKDSGAVLSVIGIAAAYAIGVTVDRLCDRIFEKLWEPIIERRVKRNHHQPDPSKEMRYRILIRSKMASYPSWTIWVEKPVADCAIHIF